MKYAAVDIGQKKLHEPDSVLSYVTVAESVPKKGKSKTQLKTGSASAMPSSTWSFESVRNENYTNERRLRKKLPGDLYKPEKDVQ